MTLFQDWNANAGDKKAQLIMLAFRTTGALNRSNALPASFLAKPSAIFYRIVVDWILTVEIPWHTSIGPRFRLQHAQAIVINGDSTIGADVSVHQGVTIGGRITGQDCPTIHDGVRIGAAAIIIGSVSIGEGAAIGAGSVVIRDVPAGASAVGNPARILG